MFPPLPLEERQAIAARIAEQERARAAKEAAEEAEAKERMMMLPSEALEYPQKYWYGPFDERYMNARRKHFTELGYPEDEWPPLVPHPAYVKYQQKQAARQQQARANAEMERARANYVRAEKPIQERWSPTAARVEPPARPTRPRPEPPPTIELVVETVAPELTEFCVDYPEPEPEVIELEAPPPAPIPAAPPPPASYRPNAAHEIFLQAVDRAQKLPKCCDRQLEDGAALELWDRAMTACREDEDASAIVFSEWVTQYAQGNLECCPCDMLLRHRA